MNKTQQIHQVELTLEEAKASVRKMEIAKKLISSPEFKEIVEDDYFTKNASRLVLLRADPGMQGTDPLGNKYQDSILKKIDAIGEFRMYISSIMQEGQSAENAIEADEATLEELREEALA